MKDCSKCGIENLDNAEICCTCGIDLLNSLDEMQGPEHFKYNRIGGWLILVAFGILVNILLALITTWLYIISLQKAKVLEEYMEVSTLPAKVGILYTAVLLILSVYLLILMYKRKRLFINIMVYYMIFISLYHIIQYGIARYVDMNIAENLDSMMLSIVSSTIWILYILQSKRVEKTFIK